MRGTNLPAVKPVGASWWNELQSRRARWAGHGVDEARGGVDNYDDDDATEHRPKEMRKVLSPQLDGLSTILKDGPLAVPPHAHEKSPGSQKLSS